MADEAQEALRRLEERLSRASDAAERLLADAARSARGDRPPPAGWQKPREDEEARVRGPAAEIEALLTAVGLLRDLIPPEVAARLASAVRELLMAVRALIDFYLERLERRPESAAEVEDIPIS